MFFYIRCSNCGKSRRLTTSRRESLENAVKKGWGSSGSALYCPKCSATWHERNTKSMSDSPNTFLVMASLIWQAQKNKD